LKNKKTWHSLRFAIFFLKKKKQPLINFQTENEQESNKLHDRAHGEERDE